MISLNKQKEQDILTALSVAKTYNRPKVDEVIAKLVTQFKGKKVKASMEDLIVILDSIRICINDFTDKETTDRFKALRDELRREQWIIS